MSQPPDVIPLTLHPSRSIFAQSGVEALKKRYLRHVHAPVRPKGEHTLQLNVIRKDSTASGKEELCAESVTVTVKEGQEEPAPTKPGMKPNVDMTRA